MKTGITILSAEDKAKEFPDTFPIPTLEARQRISVGHYAKLMFTDGMYTERMWVQVVSQDADTSYQGKLSNDPAFLGMVDQEAVGFLPEHVIDIIREEF